MYSMAILKANYETIDLPSSVLINQIVLWQWAIYHQTKDNEMQQLNIRNMNAEFIWSPRSSNIRWSLIVISLLIFFTRTYTRATRTPYKEKMWKWTAIKLNFYQYSILQFYLLWCAEQYSPAQGHSKCQRDSTRLRLNIM